MATHDRLEYVQLMAESLAATTNLQRELDAGALRVSQASQTHPPSHPLLCAANPVLCARRPLTAHCAGTKLARSRSSTTTRLSTASSNCRYPARAGCLRVSCEAT